ncbi:hypothetical protein JCM33374_g5774 [Metschnikowia sp. JCM 33374]|nr:hypothetical protein JCM33374_g5774 [Metschnikowia sp. JCM 33374]
MSPIESVGQTKSISTNYGSDKFDFHKVSFTDKLILNIMVNDVMDTTFDIPLLTSSTINRSLQREDSLGPEPIVLMGNPNNLKLQVIAGQIGKVVSQSRDPRNVILSMGSRWFGKADETNDGDFEKLMFVLQHIKSLLE